MEQCSFFASPSSSAKIFAYVQKRNGSNTHKLFVYTDLNGTKEIKFKRNQKDEVLLEIFLNEKNERFEVIFEGIKYLTSDNLTDISCTDGKPIIIEVTSDISYNEFPILPPSNLAELPLNQCSLKCCRCENILADPHPDYFVVLEQAEEIMETAMGCCRCRCSSAESHKCEHLRSPETGKIFIDDGIVLITEEYLNKKSCIKLDESSLKECSECYNKFGPIKDEYFGFQRYPSNHIEIVPFQADFVDKDGNSLLKHSYKSWSNFFASRLILTGLDTYSLITDGFGTPVFQVGFFFRRLLWINDAKTNNLKRITVLCFCYSENHTVMQKNSYAKIRLPKSLIEIFRRKLEESHQILKPFTPGYGQWKSAFLSLDCEDSS